MASESIVYDDEDFLRRVRMKIFEKAYTFLSRTSTIYYLKRRNKKHNKQKHQVCVKTQLLMLFVCFCRLYQKFLKLFQKYIYLFQITTHYILSNKKVRVKK